MKFILPIIFFILAACYSPGDCLQCYICTTPAPGPSNMGNSDPGRNNQGGLGLFGGGGGGGAGGLFGDLLSGAVSFAIPPCSMNGQSFDSSNSNYAEAKGDSPACIKSVIRIDGLNYTIRGSIRDSKLGCKEFGKETMLMLYKKSVQDDRVIFCNTCTGNYCNSGNSLNSFRLVFSTFAMLSLLYFIF